MPPLKSIRDLVQKYLKDKLFLFILINTTSAAILLIIYYQGKRTQEITRTFTCVPIQPIEQERLNQFVESLEPLKNCDVQFLRREKVSYEEKFTFLIRVRDKYAEERLNQINDQWKETFQGCCLNSYTLSRNSFSTAQIDKETLAITIQNAKQSTDQIPNAIRIVSYSETPDHLTIINAQPTEDAEWAPIQEGQCIHTVTKHYSLPKINKKTLIAIFHKRKNIFLQVFEK